MADSSLIAALRTAARWAVLAGLFVVLTYLVVLLTVSFLLAVTAPIWIWWVA